MLDLFIWGYFLHRYLDDEFAFSLVSLAGSIATQTTAVTFLQSVVGLPGTCVVILFFCEIVCNYRFCYEFFEFLRIM